MNRLPWTPLEALVDARLFRVDRPPSDVNRAALLGTNRTQVARWRRDGIPADRGDQLAEGLGFIGYEVWPSLLTQAIDDLTATCAASDCTTTFVRGPRGGKHRKWCSDVCSSRERMRRYRQTERGREQNRLIVARYKREVREAKARRAERRAA